MNDKNMNGKKNDKFNFSIKDIKQLYDESVKIEHKIIHLATMVSFLIYSKEIENEEVTQEFIDLRNIRNGLVHIEKPNLDKRAWNDRENIHNYVYNVVKDLLTKHQNI